MSNYNTPDPALDGGMSLVNREAVMLWDIDNAMKNDDLRVWDRALDRLYASLCNKSKLDIKKDDKGNIVDIKIIGTTENVIQTFKNKIRNHWLKLSKIAKKRNTAELLLEKENLRETIRIKDAFIRNLLQLNKRYLREYNNHSSDSSMTG